MGVYINKLYEMELHDIVIFELNSPDDDDDDYEACVVRVPGGWIYNFGPHKSPVFVPMDDEAYGRRMKIPGGTRYGR